MSKQKTSAELRKERLAKALKGNIAKRKDQARVRRAASDAPETPPDEDGCPN